MVICEKAELSVKWIHIAMVMYMRTIAQDIITKRKINNCTICHVIA
jgi:hypothetical protein